MATTAVASPASASGVEWEYHWWRIEDGQRVDHMTKIDPMCGGSAALRGATWDNTIYHTHYAGTFVAQGSGQFSFDYTARGLAGRAYLHVELEADYTTGEVWPEGARPQLRPVVTVEPGENIPTTTVTAAVNRPGHHVKVQIRCQQPRKPSDLRYCSYYTCGGAYFRVTNIG